MNNFSKIKNYPPDPSNYPLYYHPNNKSYEFTIYPGQCLYIPTSWWHWVFTYKDTISVTNWDKVNISNEPYLFEKESFKHISQVWTNDYLSSNLKNQVLYCYFTKDFDILSCDISTLLTNPFYFSTYAHEENEKIINILQDDINMLYQPVITQKPWYNIWFSPVLEEIDSGLHFDDGYSNYLIVLRGKKKVILFPPTSTPYLYKND